MPEAAYSVYPNPSTTGIYTITTEGNTIIKAFSIDGRLIKTQTMSDETTLDLSTAPQGVYFLQITTDKGVVTKKIVKQ